MSSEMKMMIERRLYEASLGGDITSLMELLEEDPLILEKVITSFTETPLHIAAMFGHVDFANELLHRKPDLASELDSHGFSPLHLAASRKNTVMVKLLLAANPDVCNATDQEGRTPLHLAAMKGRIEAMKELIKACPKAIHHVVSDQGGETILHLCVKHNRLEALKLLLGNLNNNKGVLDDSFISINSKDGDGNTILHLAVAKKHLQMIKFLLDNKSTTEGIEVNALNKSGFTCLDVLIIQSARDLKDIEIGEFLRGAGCVRATASSLANEESVLSPSQSQQQIPKTVQPKTNLDDNHHHEAESKEWLKNTTNSLMVVASLIATMAFQAGLTPPGDLWSDDSSDSLAPSGDYLHRHDVGTSIMADSEPDIFSLQLAFNTIGFLASLSIILLLVSGLPLRRRFFVWLLVIIMWIAITSMALSFSFITGISTSDSDVAILGKYGFFSWMGLLCLIIVLHFCRLMRRCCTDS